MLSLWANLSEQTVFNSTDTRMMPVPAKEYSQMNKENHQQINSINLKENPLLVPNSDSEKRLLNLETKQTQTKNPFAEKECMYKLKIANLDDSDGSKIMPLNLEIKPQYFDSNNFQNKNSFNEECFYTNKILLKDENPNTQYLCPPMLIPNINSAPQIIQACPLMNYQILIPLTKEQTLNMIHNLNFPNNQILFPISARIVQEKMDSKPENGKKKRKLGTKNRGYNMTLRESILDQQKLLDLINNGQKPYTKDLTKHCK